MGVIQEQTMADTDPPRQHARLKLPIDGSSDQML